MDAKGLRTEPNRNVHSTNYAQSEAPPLVSERNKPYNELGSSKLRKVDVQTSRPCAVIGPDRIVSQQSGSSEFNCNKKSYSEWAYLENGLRRPTDYVQKISEQQYPSRNISPRQTYQENMQRIMVPPRFNAKCDHATNVVEEKTLPKNVPTHLIESKFSDVPYTMNPISHEPRTSKNSEMCFSHNGTGITATTPAWPPLTAVPSRALRPPYPPDLCRYPEYSNYPVSRPIPLGRPHRSAPEETPHLNSEQYYHTSNIRYEPYPPPKDRYSNVRYEYMSNYSASYSSSNFAPHKAVPPPHAYIGYNQLPLKYLEPRMNEPLLDGYQRQSAINQMHSFNSLYGNQGVPHNYPSPIAASSIPHKLFPSTSESTMKSKICYDNANKTYTDCDPTRSKHYTHPENLYISDTITPNQIKPAGMTNYTAFNAQQLPSYPSYYRNDILNARNYDCLPQFRAVTMPNNNNRVPRMHTQISPNTMSLSDSNTPIDTILTQGTSHDDYGYLSQSPSVSGKSELSHNRMHNYEFYKKCERKYVTHRMSSSVLKSESNISKHNAIKDKKNIDVRQFLQMWNEGDEENIDNCTNKNISQPTVNHKSEVPFQYNLPSNTGDQLYVLGLVNVPSEELSKYEHIQKVSKLPENIKGYNSIELLNQFEKVLGTPNTVNKFCRSDISIKDYQRIDKHSSIRPLSPLDVEAKISQSVIHKEVGCNFEIKPCSPKMLSVDVAAPAQTLLVERPIEKVINPHVKQTLSLSTIKNDNTQSSKSTKHQKLSFQEKIPSCKLTETKHTVETLAENVKSNYNLQEFETNSGVCLASLPRLDNDIEFNFPEVNQQFLDANKAEPTPITSNSEIFNLKAQTTSNNNKKNTPQTDDNLDLPHSIQLATTAVKSVRSAGNDAKNISSTHSTKETLKLTKFRKVKLSMSNLSEDSLANMQRTDSVIIKNPDSINENFPMVNESSLTNLDQLQKRCESGLDTTNELLSPINLSSTKLGLSNCFDPDFDCSEYRNDTKDEIVAINLSLNCLDEKNSHCSPDLKINTKNNGNGILENTLCDSIVETSEIILNENQLKSIELRDQKRNINMDVITCLAEKSLTSTHNEKTSKNTGECHNIVKNQNTDKNDAIAKEYNAVMSLKLNCKIDDENLTKTGYKNTEEETCLDSNNFSMPFDNSDSIKVSQDYEPGSKYDNDENIAEIDSNHSLNDYTKFVEQIDNSTHQNNPVMLRDEKISEKLLNTTNTIDLTSYCQNNSPLLNQESIANIDLGINDDANYVEIKLYQNNSETDACPNTVADFSDDGRNNVINESNAELNVSTMTINEITKKNGNKNGDNTVNLINCQKEINNIQKFQTSQVDNILGNDKIVCSLISDKSIESIGSLKTQSYISHGDLEKIETVNNDIADTVENCSIFRLSEKQKINQSSDSAHSSSSNSLLSVISNGFVPVNELTLKYIKTECPEATKKINNLKIIATGEDGIILYEENVDHANTENQIKQYSTINNKRDNDYMGSLICSAYEETVIDHKWPINLNKSYSKFRCSKELFSPQIQNLLSCLEGIIITEKTCEVSSNAVDSSVFNINIPIIKDDESESKNFIANNLIRVPDSDSKNKITVDVCNIESHQATESLSNNEENTTETSKNMITVNDSYDKCLSFVPKEVKGKTTAKVNKCPTSSDIETSSIQSSHISKSNNIAINITTENETKSEGEIKVLHNVYATNNSKYRLKRRYMRSLSESALYNHNSESRKIIGNKDVYPYLNNNETLDSLWAKKRKSNEDFDLNVSIPDNNIFPHSRRNSIASVYSEDNMSVCIFIDKACIIADEILENDEGNACHNLIELNEQQISTAIMFPIQNDEIEIHEVESEEHNDCSLEFDDEAIKGNEYENVWVDDVACVETVISEEIIDDSSRSDLNLTSPLQIESKEQSIEDMVYSDVTFHANFDSAKIKTIYGDNMCKNDIQLVETLYRTPQMNVNSKLKLESQISISDIESSLNKSLLDYTFDKDISHKVYTTVTEKIDTSLHNISNIITEEVECKNIHMNTEEPSKQFADDSDYTLKSHSNSCDEYLQEALYNSNLSTYDLLRGYEEKQDLTHSYENSDNNKLLPNTQNTSNNHSVSSSPEVSSTTSEERSGIFLKISNYKDTKISFDDAETSSESQRKGGLRCRLTEISHYGKSESSTTVISRPLITKAAQKYIPPLKMFNNFKVKLPLPEHSLLRLKNLKVSKNLPKPGMQSVNKFSENDHKKTKKIKPNFEDVLKSIDEIQYKLHKSKYKIKRTIPKVIIKKNENGSHYTSTSNKVSNNPDLTGRKWQPWVFIEKSNFIDKMALRNKNKAIFSLNKNSYVLADEIQKHQHLEQTFKTSTNLVISRPKHDDLSKVPLKYTIKLQHIH